MIVFFVWRAAVIFNYYCICEFCVSRVVCAVIFYLLLLMRILFSRVACTAICKINSTIASSCVFRVVCAVFKLRLLLRILFSGGVRCYFNYSYYHELCFSGWRSRFSNTITIASFAFSWAVCAAIF